ncbi:MAG: DUF2207 domain-containing protein [Actinomycetia bacterium]|nr:DUF2207 domain-containing protein [Actinomycetes bacterium]
MSRYVRVTLVCCVLLVTLFAVLMPANSADAKSYSMPQVSIDAYVEPDGNVRVVESRTFDFSGDFSWVQWKMNTAGSDGIEIISVMGPSGEYRRAETEGEGPGTYVVVDEGDAVSVKLFHSTSNAQATFVIEYRARGAAKRYTDTAELYWQFVGDESEVGVGHVSIRIHLPQEYTAADVKAWAHGPLQGTVYPKDGGLVEVEVDDLPPYTFVEPRVLFPAEGLPQAPLISAPRAADVLAEEARWAEEANAQRRQARTVVTLGYVLGIGLPLLALAGAFVLWLRHGKERDSSYPGGYFRELPSDLPPALVGALWRFGTIGDEETVATLMDLSNRGIITVEPVTETKNTLLGRKTETTYKMTLDPSKVPSLQPFEQQFVSFLFTTIARGDTLTIGELEAAAKARPQTFTSGMTEWKNAVAAEADARGFFEKTGSTLKWVFIAVAVLVAVAAFFSVRIAETPLPLVVGIPCAIGIAVLGTQMPRRAPAANELYAKYRGLRDYLRDFSRLEEAPPTHIVLWEHFLVMAVVFGIAEEVIKAMRVKVPEIVSDPALARTMWWVTPTHGNVSPATAFTSGFASAAHVASSQMSSSSGGGGGFSGGGGGGGGGGGVSAG